MFKSSKLPLLSHFSLSMTRQSKGRGDWGRNRLRRREESPTWGSLIKQGISAVSNPWHHASKAVLSWKSFLLSQVSQSVDVEVIILVRVMRRERCIKEGGAWHSDLRWEHSVRSWDESATQEGGKRRKTHIGLDRTKAYKCARIRP